MDDEVGSGEEGVGRKMIHDFRGWAAPGVVAALLLSGCMTTSPPVVDPVMPTLSDRPTVIFVSGLTGSVLYDRVAKHVAWGDARSAFLPHDRGYATARPIGGALDRIEARGAIEEITLGPLYRMELYGPVVTSFEANGYRSGVDFFLFGYDWRQSNVASARQLARLIDEAGGDGPVVLVCQSNGGYLCRWAVRFGDVGLHDAEQGVVRRPRAEVDAMIFVGTTHAGSIRILREIDRGRTYVRFGRFLSPELFFTFESLYQDLPPWRSDLFVDQDGQLIDVDLFDAATWARYGWSIFGAEAEARADSRPDLFGQREDRLAFLQRALDDARRFHKVLRDGPPPPRTIRYYSVQSRSRRTIDRAMLVDRNGAWQTLFIGDPFVDARPELESILSTWGDAHASASGQEALSETERSLVASAVIEVDGDHLDVFQSPESQRAILRIVRESQEREGESRTSDVGIRKVESGSGGG